MVAQGENSEEAEKGRERRKIERIDCKDVWMSYEPKVPSFTLILSKEKKKRKPVPVKDLSRSGLGFLSKEKLKEGRELSMHLMLGPRQPKVTIEGEVRSLREGQGRYSYRVGVGFTNMSPETWRRLCNIHREVRKKDDSWREWSFNTREEGRRSRSTPYEESVSDAFSPMKDGENSDNGAAEKRNGNG